jgi:hypothetical protein
MPCYFFLAIDSSILDFAFDGRSDDDEEFSPIRGLIIFEANRRRAAEPADFQQHCIQEAASTGGRGRKLIQFRLGWRTFGEMRT